MASHAPRTGSSGEVGALRGQFLSADNYFIRLYVPHPVAVEGDFWFCTLRAEADNADHYFGPLG